MDVTINNQRLPASEVDGRYYRVFTPRSKSDKIRIHRDMSCLGTTVLSNIQLEQGTVPTAFVEPASESRNLSGLFNDLREIRLEMRDPNSEFWGKIVANNKGALVEFANKEMRTAQAQTADSIMREVRSTLNGNYSSFEQRLNGTKAQIVTETTKSVTTNLSNLYDKQISDINGNLSRQSQSLTAFQRSLQDTNGNLSQAVQKIDGFQRDVTSVSGTASRALQTANQVSTSLTALDGRVSTAIRTVDGFRSEIASAKNDTNSRITQLSNLIDQRVTRSDVTSIIRQSGDNIMLAIQGKLPKSEAKMSGEEIVSAINLTREGVRVIGKKVHITGDTLMDNASIKGAAIQSLSADKIVGGTIDARQVNVINVNASNIVAGTMKGMTLQGGSLSAINGAMSIDLNNGQYNVFTENAALRRVVSGYPTQFLKFGTGALWNADRTAFHKSGGTFIGSNSDGSENSNNETFSGLRMWNNQKERTIEIIGNLVRIANKGFAESGEEKECYWQFETRKEKMVLVPSNVPKDSEAIVVANDFVIQTSSGKSLRLSRIIRLLERNFDVIINESGSITTRFGLD